MQIIIITSFIVLSFFIIDANAENKKTFIIDGYIITTFNDHVVDISLDWDSEELELGSITLDQPVNSTIKISIPKEMPRLTNLDFGHFSLHAIQTDESWSQIKEIESNCFYHLEIPVNNSDYIEIIGGSVSAGRWEAVAILDQSCGDFTLKQQIESNVPVDKIECRNKMHVLVERDNGNFACVYPTTAERLGWQYVIWTQN